MLKTTKIEVERAQLRTRSNLKLNRTRENMFDTVQLKLHRFVRFRDRQLVQLGAEEPKRPTRISQWNLNPKKGSGDPRITFYFPPNRVMYIVAEASVPRLLFGHNSRLPTENEAKTAIGDICKYVSTRTDTEFTPENTSVSLVDFAYDLPADETTVHRILRQFVQVRIPRTHKTVYQDTTLYFKFGKRAKQYRIYPKLQEVTSRRNAQKDALDAASGKLRFEARYPNKNQVDRLVGQLRLSGSKPSQLLKADVSKSVIDEMWGRLGFNVHSLGPAKPTVQALFDTYPGSKAIRLLGFLKAREQLGPDFFRDPRNGFSAKNNSRYIEECRDAGIPL